MSNDEITSAALDRLVDGELAPNERRELLLLLEESHDGWRRCALAFLEAQAWRGEFRAAIAAPPARAALASGGTGSWSMHALRLFALAASLLFAFWLGSTAGWRADAPLVTGTNSIQSVGRDESAAIPQVEPGGSDDVITLWAHDANGVAQPLHVSLVDADPIDAQLGLKSPPRVSPELKQRLHDRGYQVESRRRYAPLWLEQGQSLMVPVEDARIVPVSREVL